MLRTSKAVWKRGRPIGSREWFTYESAYAVQGTVDHILRLFEQERITRSKCRELIQYATCSLIHPKDDKPPPTAPWNELKW